ncbi:MAG: TonB-dependent receptor [Proteobacteria bacterium]|nr:TonB-dependent receptor [Pseudomonadota bacterium]
MNNKRAITIAALSFLSCGTMAMAGSTTNNTSDQEAKAFLSMFGQGPQEEDVYRTDRLLLTATGSLKPVHLAPSVASVITKEDIEAMGATTLDEVLETVPGLHVESSGLQYFSSIWSIRGIHTSINPQTLLLINGVPFTFNFIGGRYQTFKMPTAMISRVEVVRGPGSALHGADAFSGTINVITKDNFEIDGTKAGVRYGSFNTVDTWVQQGGQYGGWDLALGVEWQKTSGDHDRIIDRDRMHAFPPALGLAAYSKAPGPLDTSYEILDTHLNLRRGDWNLHLYGTLEDSSAGAGGAQAITDGNDADTKSLLADLSYSNDHSLEDWTLGGRLSYSYIKQDSFLQYYPPATYPAIPALAFLNMLGEPIQTSTDGGIETNALYKGFKDHQVRLGLGMKNYNFDRDQYKNFLFTYAPPPNPAIAIVPWFQVTDPSLIYIDQASRTLWYALIQDEWQLAPRWTLTGGVRHDEYSDFGSTVNPRAALVWETRYNLTTKLMYGTAFRAPSFSEQFAKNNPVTVGNANLTPEEIETEELAFDYQPSKDLRLILSLFTYKATEIIEITPAVPISQFTNYGTIRGKGFEVEAEWQLASSLMLRTNFAYQRSKNTTIDSLVADAPEMQFYLAPHWEFLPEWSLDGQFTWVGDRPRAKGDPRPEINTYELVNLTLRRTNIAKHWDVALAVRNLFDENARIPSPYAPGATDGAYIPNDYPMATRAVWAEVSCHF